jgi:Fungal tRNA ligase phosphodiesterase domain
MPYTALVLDEKSHNKLVSILNSSIPNGWTIFAHHMTCNLGKPESGPANDYVGKTCEVTVVSAAADNKVFAVGVESDVPSVNKRKHITVAVNSSQGGKPKMSNDLKSWVTLHPPLVLTGIVKEVS